MKLSLRNRILAYARKEGVWINGGQIEKLAEEAGYKASNASRRCRELENDGLLEREVKHGQRANSVWYRAKVHAVESTFVLFPEGRREIKKVIWQ